MTCCRKGAFSVHQNTKPMLRLSTSTKTCSRLGHLTLSNKNLRGGGRGEHASTSNFLVKAIKCLVS